MRRIFETEIDAVITRNLKHNERFRRGVTVSTLGQEIDEVPNIKAQAAHVGSTGTIDLDIRLRGNRRLLLENKINAKYSVTVDGDQPSRYRKTAEAYRGYGVDCRTLLVAPNTYLRARGEACGFDLTLSYELMGDWLIGDDLAVVQAAIQQAETPYIGEMVEANTKFFRHYGELVQSDYPDLVLKRSPNADGARPATSRSIYFDVPRTLKVHQGVPRPSMSIQCWEQAQPSPSVKIMIGKWASLGRTLTVPADLAAIGGYLRPAAQSLGITVDTPLMEVDRPFWEQIDAVRYGLEAAVRLREWWNASAVDLLHWVEVAVKSGLSPAGSTDLNLNSVHQPWPIAAIINDAYARNPSYLEVIDDVVAGELDASQIEKRHGSRDVIVSALSHVTRKVHGIGSGSVPALEDGGWYARLGNHHVVHPAFRHAWRSARAC